MHKDQVEPTVTVVIAARNEAQRIQQRLDNIFEQSYPKAKLDVVVVSDGSSDGTREYLEKMHNSRITVVELPVSLGKAAAVNAGVMAASGEIIVFTDARQKFSPSAVEHLTANFADSSVGCVSGELFFLDDAESAVAAEMGAYWKYEKWIRKAESRTGSVVGATGSIYAIRRSLFLPLPVGTILDDVLTPLTVARQGFRVQFEERAKAFDIISKDLSQEWTRKVRTLAGNWQLLSLEPSLLLPWRNPLWWRFLSHKIFRLIVPFALIGALFSSFFLAGIVAYTAIAAQASFYAVVVAAGMVPKARSVRLVNICYFFVVMNAAALSGFWCWITGRCGSAWKPAYTGKI